MKAFHEGHPDVALELQVTRHPFSFIGDLDERQIEAGSSLKKKGTWRDRLLDYTGGNEHMRDQAMMGMIQAGKPLGIKFDYNCYIDRQPIDSQRMLLYAASHGKQEAYVSALSKRHFEHGSDGESASKRHTVLAAAAGCLATTTTTTTSLAAASSTRAVHSVLSIPFGGSGIVAIKSS